MVVLIYISSVSSNQEIKKQQQKITMVLDGKKIAHECRDICVSEEDKQRMRDLAGDPHALPPQICNDDKYCGNFDDFEAAIEDERLKEFLKL